MHGAGGQSAGHVGAKGVMDPEDGGDFRSDPKTLTPIDAPLVDTPGDGAGEARMTLTQAARCLGWSRETVQYRARNDGVLIDGRTLPHYYMTRPRWFVPESWVDRVGAPRPEREEGGA